MTEYIEREALLKKAIEERRFVFQLEDLINREVVFLTVYKDLADFVWGIPAADVEKRVRCEDCVSSGGDRFGELICQNQLCPCYNREVDHAFSCILGERRISE